MSDSVQPGMKQCSKCKDVKPLTEFRSRHDRKSGYRSNCKDCVRIQQGYTKPEEFPPGMKRCAKCKAMFPLDQFYARSDQIGKVRAYCKGCQSIHASLYNSTHKEERNKKSMEYYFAHRERFREYSKKYLLEHPMATASYCRKHYQNNREKVKAQNRQYYQNNILSRRAKRAQRRFIERSGDADYASIWERDKGICHICQKEVILKDLHFDHVIPVARGGQHTMDNVKVSHALCNRRKGAKLMEELLWVNTWKGYIVQKTSLLVPLHNG